MKRIAKLCVVAALVAVALAAGCAWEDSDDFNTSQGAGADIVFSGMYTPLESTFIGSTNVTSLLLTQIGNRIDVSDNMNKKYSGSVGSPGVMKASADGTYPAGATLLQTQINFATTGDSVSQHDDMSFAGIIRTVAVEDTVVSETTIDIAEDELTKTTTRTYNVTEATTRFYMEGNWLHFVDGEQVVAVIRAEAKAATLTMTTTDTTATP